MADREYGELSLRPTLEIMRELYWKCRARMVAAGLWPQGWIGRGAYYSVALAVGLFILQILLRPFSPAWGDGLTGWIRFLVFDAALLFSISFFRVLKRKLLWRVRNRLIVTYVFIGVIPVVLLVLMAVITAYLFAGQFASFVVTSEIKSQLRSMQAMDAALGNELAARVEKGEAPTADSLAGLRKRDQAWGRRQVFAWLGAEALPIGGRQSASMTLPEFLNNNDNSYAKALRSGQPFTQIVRDQGDLYLRAASMFDVGASKLTVVTSEPFDRNLIAKIASNLGEITLYPAGFNWDERQNGRPKQNAASAGSASTSQAVAEQALRPTFSVGTLPPGDNMMDHEITFGTPLQVVNWTTGNLDRAGALVKVRTRPSVLYGHLFAALGDIASGVEYLLLAILVFFGVIELIALITGTRMTRTVTGAVAQLYDATGHINRGDFSHRIPVKSDDQLAQLSLSFNSMTESIEKLILEQKEKQRLEGELAIAQEVQSQLFPQQISEIESLEVHGFCRPARTVSGDYYDFLTASSHKMILAVGDISGKGISAALLMATIHSAVRAYSIESLPQMREPVVVGAAAGPGRVMAAWPQGIEVSPGSLLGLLNHQLYESTPPEKYATLFLGIYDGRSRRLTYSNGGHLPPILIGEDGRIRRLECGGTVVGLFDNMSYDED
ncbi:MAG: SpoIIE family protein phosphatase, partial [Candidatus Sulfotelmatobacter sp.]